MKKKLLTLFTLFLCAASGAMAQTAYTWDFTNIPEDVWTKMQNAKCNWAYDNEDGADRCTNVNVLKDSTLMVGKEELSITKGLTFTAGLDSKSVGRLKIDRTAGRMQLNGTSVVITTPELEAGQIITVECMTSKPTAARGLTISNTVNIGDATDSKERRMYVKYVKAKGVVTIKSNDSGMNIFRINITKETVTDVNAYNKIVVPIALDQYGYSTFSSVYPVDLSTLYDNENCSSVSSTTVEGFVVSSYTGDNNKTVATKHYTKIPPRTGIILKYAALKDGNKTVYAKCGIPEAIDNNYLVPVIESAEIPYSTTGSYNYAFGYTGEGENIGFYYIAKSGTAFTSKANKAYLSIPMGLKDAKSQANDEAKYISLDFSDSEVTGISEVKAQTVENDVYYTISGQPVANPTKGLYIKNGKKVIIK